MTMTVKFDNITVEIQNPVVQAQIKKFIMRAAGEDKNHKPWTTQDDELLAEGIKMGAKATDIAKELKRTIAAIHTRTSVLGLHQKAEDKVIQL